MAKAAIQRPLWDAKDELVGIAHVNGAAGTFTYEGLHRHVGIVEKTSPGTVTFTKQFVWIDNTKAECEMTNSSGQIVSRLDYDPYKRIQLVSGDYTHKQAG